MKKITLTITLLSLIFLPNLAFAEEIILAVGTSSTSTSTASTTPWVKPFTICSQESIERRDTNIASSRSLYNVAMTNALIERKNREKAAIAIDDEDKKKVAIRSSVDTYKNQAKAAQYTLTQTRKALWQTFENDIKNCRNTVANTEKDSPADEKPSKATIPKKTDDSEVKSIQETIKDTIVNFLSIFSNN